jgi:hypothetical protein
MIREPLLDARLRYLSEVTQVSENCRRGFLPMRWLFMVMLSTTLSACASTQSPDAALADALVGKWSWNRGAGCCTRFEQSIEFKADGSFLGDGVRRDAAGSKPYSFGGQWKVEDGHLKLNETAPPLDMPKSETIERIVFLAGMQLVTVQPHTGREHRAWRYSR